MPIKSVQKIEDFPTLSSNRLTEGTYLYDAPNDRTEILWKCLVCGELKPRYQWIPGDCPSCGAPKSQFVLVDED